jgi:hypothetical protein
MVADSTRSVRLGELLVAEELTERSDKAVSAFEIVHQDRIVGKLVGFDRLIFKGHFIPLVAKGGMKTFLDRQGILLKDFGTTAQAWSDAVKAHAKAAAAEARRPYIYLADAPTRAKGQTKEEYAQAIAARDRVRKGLVCVLAVVENCRGFDIYRNNKTHRLELVRRGRKCLFFYYYLVHPDFGFCHVRVQSWAPFEVQVWTNGREALSSALTARRVPLRRYHNAIVWVARFALAQRLADRLASRKWVRTLDALGHMVNPHVPLVRRMTGKGYWWVVDQAEVATDVAFGSRAALEAILPSLIAHAATCFSAEDVLRFLGRKLHPSLAQEVTTDARRRPEGWRIKHRMGRNSVKVYDKGLVLRVETTINDPTQFRVLRVRDGRRVWCPMRKGVANLPRYYQVGRAANERYLDALAAAPDNRGAIALLDRHTRPITNRGRRHARLNPVSKQDLALYRAVMAGEHAIVGFRNHHITERLHPRPPRDDTEARRRCQQVSRQIQKLRGHGLVAKVPHQRLYRVTRYGQRYMATAIAMHDRYFPLAYAATEAA